MRLIRSVSRSSARLFSLLLSYLMVISLCAPFSLKRVVAATANAPSKAAAAASNDTAKAARKQGQRRDNQLLVRFREGVTEQKKNALIGENGGRRAKKLKGRSRIEKLEFQQGVDVDALAAELRANPAVELVEPNFLISRDQATTPGDPRFSEQWALQNTGSTGGQPGADIQAMQAWAKNTGASTTVVAVIDSGIDFTHPDLQNNQWTNNAEQENNRDDDHNGLTNDLHGWDFVADDNDARDEQGHGTAVAGIIAAQGNNSIGITGVMWRASLMSLRVLDNTGMGEIADAVEAIDYAAGHGAQVINCSWGTDEESLALKDAIERAGTSGAVLISSAGNGGRNIESEPYYPSSFGLSNQIVVAATDNFDHLPSWSNYGATHVTVAAPGTDILTTRIGGDYTIVTGTSASTPMVTGVVGLIKTQRWWLSAAGTRAAIVEGARRVAEFNGKVSSGGVVSASGSLNALQGPDTQPNGSGDGNNGNGNGNNGNGNNRPARPSTYGHGSGGTGENEDFSTTPPPVTQTVPGTGNRNLDEMRRTPSYEPKAKAPIHSDAYLPECDLDCGGSAPPSAGGSDPYFATPRTQPANETGQPGVDLGSRNFNWSLPLLGLPGRAGLDLSLALSYNSLVWTKRIAFPNQSVMFNADRGFPGPGFNLGFPVLQEEYYDTDEAANSFLLIIPGGGRVQLKQTASPNVYESIDSSYTQLVDSRSTSGGLVVFTKDGTQLIFGFSSPDGDYRCTQMKDRNGNYISVAYNSLGRISTITDTLARVVNFNYDANDYLASITQTWNGQTHTWATFTFGELYMQPSFHSVISVLGPVNTTIPVLSYVSLDDGSYYAFNYTSFGQVNKITHHAPSGVQLSYTSYNLDTSAGQIDCPRFTERRDWAARWNNEQEAVTTYSVASDSSWTQATMPDGTVYKELFSTASNWQKGLTIGTEIWSGVVKKKWTTTAYTQDDTNLSYQKNPRVTETNIYDSDNNRKRTTIDYGQYAQWGLPYLVTEYAADGVTQLRRTFTDYYTSQDYLARHIIGLPSEMHTGDASQLLSKTVYYYDLGGEYLQATTAATTQHDANYAASFTVGRGNISAIARFDATDITNGNKRLITYLGYDTNGSVIFKRDESNHQTSISYADSFSDGVNRNTFAYPTTTTDPDNYSSTAQYDYNFGATTRTQDPKGAAASMEYDAARRPTRVTNLVNNAYKRWTYSIDADYSQEFTTINGLTQEGSTFTLYDGAGRVHGEGGALPNSPNYFFKKIVFDAMGRAVKVSNTTEITGSYVPTGDDAAGFAWTIQAYDWKGRPTVTTMPDGYTTEQSYGGCGCAGGEVVTTRDVAGRRRKMTMDVLGRLKQVEELNWDQTVYSTTTYAYNVRDQITSINQAGQIRSFEYDGYGRLWRRTTPEQGQTTYVYNPDDTVQSVTDARGATSTLGYNNRQLPTSITYGVPSGVAATANVNFGYDAAGNRTSMTDGLGSASYQYDTLSRLTSETRNFTGLGSYTLSYTYNLAGELTSVTNPWNVQVGYTYDQAGRTTAVTGSGYYGVSSYINSLTYRAFGGVKQINYGNTRQLSLQYDNRLRLTRWDVAGVLGSQYQYLWEETHRPTFASNLYDATLDRLYIYDNVGRLHIGRSGSEARAGYGQQWNGLYDGPYSSGIFYDVWGNLTYKEGWGGVNPAYTATYTNNRRDGFSYDAAGNLTNDGVQSYTYDATGQQTFASGTNLTQSYDGDGVRAKKVESGASTYYLRSSVLGNQVIAELSGSGVWQRGYVYLGGQLLAVQDSGVLWAHQDPITKSQRLTNSAGSVVSWVELDPWGGETGRSSNQSLQPHRYTSYERDNNGGDEAMFRRYESQWQRFAQPDPFDANQDMKRYRKTPVAITRL
jgi:YD repeat-containing protein